MPDLLAALTVDSSTMYTWVHHLVPLLVKQTEQTDARPASETIATVNAFGSADDAGAKASGRHPSPSSGATAGVEWVRNGGFEEELVGREKLQRVDLEIVAGGVAGKALKATHREGRYASPIQSVRDALLKNGPRHDGRARLLPSRRVESCFATGQDAGRCPDRRRDRPEMDPYVRGRSDRGRPEITLGREAGAVWHEGTRVERQLGLPITWLTRRHSRNPVFSGIFRVSCVSLTCNLLHDSALFCRPFLPDFLPSGCRRKSIWDSVSFQARVAACCTHQRWRTTTAGPRMDQSESLLKRHSCLAACNCPVAPLFRCFPEPVLTLTDDDIK